MNKAKFWLVQIVMVTIVSLTLGTAAFSAPPVDLPDAADARGDNGKPAGAGASDGHADDAATGSEGGTGGGGGCEDSCL